MTRIRSASRMVDSRWVMITLVRPSSSGASDCWTLSLRHGVERAGRLVENQDARILQDRPRDGDPLPLACGEPIAAFSDHACRTRPAARRCDRGSAPAGRRLRLAPARLTGFRSAGSRAPWRGGETSPGSRRRCWRAMTTRTRAAGPSRRGALPPRSDRTERMISAPSVVLPAPEGRRCRRSCLRDRQVDRRQRRGRFILVDDADVSELEPARDPPQRRQRRLLRAVARFGRGRRTRARSRRSSSSGRRARSPDRSPGCRRAS